MKDEQQRAQEHSRSIIADALQRCADMDSATARGYRIDAENCEQSDSEVIRDRAELLRFRAGKLEEKAAEYRRVISSQNAATHAPGANETPLK